MKLTDQQSEKAIGLRELLANPRPEGELAWSACMDFTRALGKMLDGVDQVQNPIDMRKTFDAAWRAYATYWGAEHDRILFQALGNDEVLVSRVKEHENGRRIIQRILDRVKEQHGGITTEVDASSTEITDILVEEMDGEWGEG